MYLSITLFDTSYKNTIKRYKYYSINNNDQLFSLYKCIVKLYKMETVLNNNNFVIDNKNNYCEDGRIHERGGTVGGRPQKYTYFSKYCRSLTYYRRFSYLVRISLIKNKWGLLLPHCSVFLLHFWLLHSFFFSWLNKICMLRTGLAEALSRKRDLNFLLDTTNL